MEVALSKTPRGVRAAHSIEMAIGDMSLLLVVQCINEGNLKVADLLLR